MMKNFWMDEGGALLSMEAVLLATILVIGVVVGLSALQDAVVQELADVGAAIGSVNQSFSLGAVAGHHGATSCGQDFDDAQDSCDDTVSNGNANGDNNTRCVTLSNAGSGEP